MREILFRGKWVDNGEWVYGAFCPDALELINGAKNPYLDGFIRNFNETTLKMQMHEVDRETVGQFTGLTDKNGKEIFEGDVLLCEYPSSVWRGYVVWGTGCFSVQSCTRKDNPAIDIVLHYGTVEVIGNIHDDPELIGGVDNG